MGVGALEYVLPPADCCAPVACKNMPFALRALPPCPTLRASSTGEPRARLFVHTLVPLEIFGTPARRDYGEEEVSSDHLDTDFPDIDLSQLYASDFDSVNCLSELPWCNDQSDASPASIQYSTGDPEFLEIEEEENAALLAALTDSLDEMVEDESRDRRPVSTEKAPAVPPNVPVSIETHKEGGTHRHSNRSQYLKPLRPLVKCERTQERKPRADESDSEEEDGEEEEEEEEEGDESASEDESSAAVAAAAAAGAPQFSSEKELRSVVELITYMHTYCLPTRKQAGWDRRDRECQGFARRARPEAPPPGPAPPRLPQGRRPRPPAPPSRADARSRALSPPGAAGDGRLVRRQQALQAPQPPYSRCGAGAQEGRGSRRPARQTELKDSGPTGRGTAGPGRAPTGPKRAESRRRGTPPSRCAARAAWRPSRPLLQEGPGGGGGSRLLATRRGGGDRPASPRGGGGPRQDALQGRRPEDGSGRAAWSLNEKRACLCLPLTPKSTGDTQFANKAFEQTLSVELCGTAGLTPPTTPAQARRGRALQAGGEGGLRRMGQASEREAKGAARRAFGDHDYCLQGLGESRKRPAPSCGEEEEEEEEDEEEEEGSWAGGCLSEEKLFSKLPDYLCGQGSGTASPRSASPQALSPRNTEESAGCSPRPSSPNLHAPCTSCCLPHSSSSKLSFSCENLGTCYGDKLRSKVNEDCRVFYIHNLPSGVTQAMLRRRFQAFGEPDDCKIITKNDERCGVITFLGPPSGQGLRRRRDPPAQNARSSPRRFCRKRYIDLDEAGPGPVKSKYDALDFDTLLKEAQRSLHR
ncbi:hypothetical protein ANANG_G00060570 [Anguilla anguilla]|uniref:RRM domain-containing protein n=1 Tax=Anguilla anguilla TaxID=7936 RepID=A0A9D3MS01_ANGAN|nr:hypothetical protein ANANG_G00060570 [Anguilla anguilla]